MNPKRARKVARQLLLAFVALQGSVALADPDSSSSPVEAAAENGQNSITLLSKLPGDALVRLQQVDVSAEKLLEQLVEVSGVRVDAEFDGDQKISLMFESISATRVVALIADSAGMTLAYRHDGSIVMRRPEDLQEELRLHQKYSEASSAKDDSGELKALEEIRAYSRARDPAELTPPGGDLFWIEELAERYRSAENIVELVALRREQLANAERYDQRATSLSVAFARVSLAEALQSSAAKTDEDLRLLKLALPVVMSDPAPLSYGVDAPRLAQTFVTHGMDDAALHILLSAWNHNAVDGDWEGIERSFIAITNNISFDLLRQYLRRQDDAGGKAVLAIWQSYLEKAGEAHFPLAGFEDASEALRRGDFEKTAEICDVAIARLPQGEQLTTETLATWSNLALGAQLGSGQLVRAARSFARNRALLALELPVDAPEIKLRERQQAVLNAWAAGQSVESGWWTARDTMDVSKLLATRSDQPVQLAYYGVDSAASQLMISILVRQTQRQPVDLALAETADLVGLLMLAASPGIEQNSEAERWLASSRQWREELGASAVELAAYDDRVTMKRSEIRKLMKAPTRS